VSYAAMVPGRNKLIDLAGFFFLLNEALKKSRPGVCVWSISFR